MNAITQPSPLWIKLQNLCHGAVERWPPQWQTSRVCQHGLGPLRVLHQRRQMGAPLYRSPWGDITPPRCTELMMKANISVLTCIYQINFIFTDPPQTYWHIDALQAEEGVEGGWVGQAAAGGDGVSGGSQWGLMAFTIFNAEGCHHWISILNNVAFHHKFFTTYLLNGKSYGSLSVW